MGFFLLYNAIMAVFYRTYRPQKFSEVVGQAPIVSTLRNAVKNGSVAHAYLFTGSRGVGKTTLARLLAKAVNCPNVKDGEPCGTCEVCQAIKNNLFIDLVEIDAASHTGVDNVRELIEHIKFKPTSAKYKVFIIDEVHMLSKAAFNALLKTLEEPPDHAIFVLATTDVHKVPATIVSRTQRFDFSRITTSDIVAQLEKVVKAEKLKVEPQVLRLIARQAAGGLRDALSLLNKVAASGGKVGLPEAETLLGSASLNHSEKLVDLMAEGDSKAIPAYFEELEQAGIDFAVFNKSFLEYLRGLLIAKVTGDVPADFLPEEASVMENQVAKVSAAQVIHWLRLFLRSFKDLSSVPEPSLALLLAAMEAVIKPGVMTATAQPISTATPKVSQAATKSSEQQTSSSTAPIAQATRTAQIDDPIVEEIVEIDYKGQPFTLEEVKGFWPEVLNRLKLINSPLATLIKNSPVVEVSGQEICLSVKFLFHKEHLESKKIYSLVTSTIQELGGKPCRLRILLNAEPQTEAPTGVDAISEVLRVFGGELVE